VIDQQKDPLFVDLVPELDSTQGAGTLPASVITHQLYPLVLKDVSVLRNASLFQDMSRMTKNTPLVCQLIIDIVSNQHHDGAHREVQGSGDLGLMDPPLRHMAKTGR